MLLANKDSVMTVLDTLNFMAFKPLEFAKGKNAIELTSEAKVTNILNKVREAAVLGQSDALIEQQAQFDRRVTQKNKRTGMD